MGKAVKSIFGGSKPKAPPPPPPPPTEDSAAEKLAREANEQRMRAGAGRASTMLTTGEGVTEELNTAKKKLLGA